jgi:hypothetical protein
MKKLLYVLTYVLGASGVSHHLSCGSPPLGGGGLAIAPTGEFSVIRVVHASYNVVLRILFDEMIDFQLELL